MDHFPHLPDDLTSIEVIRVRHQMAQAYAHMMNTAFDALLFHGVNYRTLAFYGDRELLESAKSKPLRQGQSAYFQWIKRLESAIRAEVRRKALRRIDTPPPT